MKDDARKLELIGPAVDLEGRRYGRWPGTYWVKRGRIAVNGKGWPR